MFNNDIMDEQTQDFIFPWRIRLELNRNKMYQHSISCIQVAEKVQDAYRDLYAIPSPDNIGVIDIYVDFEHMKLKKKEEEDLANLPYKEMVCMRNIIIPMLQDILISGISGIEQVHLSQNENKEWIVNTQGSNLMDIFQNDLLDHHRCLSSDIWEIRKTLGIEATRQFIINEFYKVLAGGGASVGRRHLELLADSMTFQGKISSVNRYGIDRNETGPLAKASFEESVNNFFIAAANGEKDEMGVSSSVMAGKLAQFGTGYFDLVVDPESFKKINVSDLPDPIKERDKIRMQEEMVKKMRNVSLGPSVPLPQKPIFPSSYAPQRSEPRTGSSIIGLNLTNFDSMVGPVQENIHPMFRIPEENPAPPPRVIEQKNRVAAKPVLKQAVEEVDDTQKLSWTKKKPAKVSVSFSADD